VQTSAWERDVPGRWVFSLPGHRVPIPTTGKPICALVRCSTTPKKPTTTQEGGRELPAHKPSCLREDLFSPGQYPARFPAQMSGPAEEKHHYTSFTTQGEGRSHRRMPQRPRGAMTVTPHGLQRQ
jgi:hypothetical protein